MSAKGRQRPDRHREEEDRLRWDVRTSNPGRAVRRPLVGSTPILLRHQAMRIVTMPIHGTCRTAFMSSQRALCSPSASNSGTRRSGGIGSDLRELAMDAVLRVVRNTPFSVSAPLSILVVLDFGPAALALVDCDLYSSTCRSCALSATI